MSKIIVLPVLGVLVGATAFFGITMYSEYTKESVETNKEIVVTIEEGQGVSDIANTLKEEGLIHYPVLFYLKAKEMGADTKLRYGEFAVAEGSSLEDIVLSLTTGGAKKEEAKITIPEGYSVLKTAKLVAAMNLCTEQDFLAALEKDYDYWFLESIPDDADVLCRLEGFLYPDTYAIADNATAEDLVRMMLEQFGKVYTEEMKAKAEQMGMTTYEVITKASVVEREAKIKEERPVIAGVIENRLNSNMALQMCPTVLYPLTNGQYDKEVVTYEDTEYQSPYNTYVHSGLPVGPIACPGISSIEAVLNPEKHEYLFYHTDEEKKNGSHIFTKTYSEHQETQN